MKIAMPEQETNALKELIDSSTNILEYGSGGSTIYASNSKAKCILSVDNDNEWIEKIIKEYENIDYPKPKLITVHSYIGPSGLWGYPKDKSHQEQWKYYPIDVWDEANIVGISPDTIIIDGRFRVACFLYSIASAKPGTKIFWDDYVNRESYHVVENILKPEKTVGRAAIFTVGKHELNEEMFNKYCNDVR